LCYPISTQTYTRKVDVCVANALSGLGSTVQKIASDIRHLAHMKEIEEPFETDQIGSSAMAYKRNPMRSERIAGLGRHLANLNKDAADTYATQWFERTLDDSAIRRIYLPEMYLCADAILLTLDNVVSGLVVYPARIAARLAEELPFMATENIIMRIVAAGGSRQEAHERVRVLSHQAGDVVKRLGLPNDLVDRIKADPYFAAVADQLDDVLQPAHFIGRCPEQVMQYCGRGSEVAFALEPYRAAIDGAAAEELHV
jgi:adenylosuccinate lyase